MRLRGRQLDAINAALKNGTAEDFNAALQKTCAQADGIGQFVPAQGSAASWRNLAMRLADESTAVLDNAHWEVKHGSGDLLTTIKAVREKYRLETQMPPNND